MTYLRNFGVLNVKDRLARIRGVGQVQIWGAGDSAMRVWLDPQKVADAIRNDTCLVSVMLANNEIGVTQPLAEIASRRAKCAEWH